MLSNKSPNPKSVLSVELSGNSANHFSINLTFNVNVLCSTALFIIAEQSHAMFDKKK